MITNDIKYVGVNDHTIDLFEGQYKVENGMSYNSYVILDKKTAVVDSVDIRFADEWLSNIDKALDGKSPDYLIVQHMEPDHSSSIHTFKQKYPDCVVVSSDKAFAMMQKFFATDYATTRVVVKDGDTLSLGDHTLTFYAAPMVHWPEVIMTYDSCDKVLFSADALGKFGALDVDEPWLDEARRYYIGIVGKYGVQVQNTLKKLSALDVSIICALHGPVLKENLGYYLDKYNTWSSYEPETDGVTVCYTSVYGNTKKAALSLADKLKETGTCVDLFDLARCDISEAVACAFKKDRLVLATTTYNAELFPFMREFVHELIERGYKNRKIGIIENGSWAPSAARQIKKAFENSKEIIFVEPTVTVHSSPDEQTIAQITALVDNLKGEN